MIKLVCFLKRKPGLTHDEFIDHWLNRHAPLIASTPELARHVVRYEQLRPTPHASWMGTPDYDGITMQWMESAQSFEDFLAEPTYAALIAPDEKTFLDTSALVWMITEEPVIAIDGPAT